MTLSKIAQSEPQSAYAAFVSGFRHKLTYYMRTIPRLGTLLQPVDNVINQHFLPTITEGQYCSQEERKRLSLPARYGGLGISIFSEAPPKKYEYSKQFAINIQTQTVECCFYSRAHLL